MRDPYEVLGVTRQAGDAYIKKAFRRLAKKFHPDQSKDPKAKERFAEINNAYEIVGDAQKRAQFDKGEIGADGKPKLQGFEGFGAGGPRPGPGGTAFRWSTGGPAGGRGGFSADDFLGDLFGRGFGGGAARGPRQPAAGARGSDVTASAAVTLEQIASGDKVRVDLPTGKAVEFALPPGVRSGQTIRLKGQGQAAPLGWSAGDALVTVEFVPHPHLRAEGENLRLDLPIALEDAVLGARVKVPTLEGSVTMTVPPGSDGGRSLRLKGKGLAGAGGARGDILVALRIVLPDPIDPELDALARRRRRESGINAKSRAVET